MKKWLKVAYGLYFVLMVTAGIYFLLDTWRMHSDRQECKARQQEVLMWQSQMAYIVTRMIAHAWHGLSEEALLQEADAVGLELVLSQENSIIKYCSQDLNFCIYVEDGKVSDVLRID